MQHPGKGYRYLSVGRLGDNMKTDLKKKHKKLYKASAQTASVLNVPRLNCIMIDGAGGPDGSSEFPSAVEALYGTVYTVKFSLKKATGQEFQVMPLEGLWWMDGGKRFDPANKEGWRWTLFIVVPDFVYDKAVDAAKRAVEKKKGNKSAVRIRREFLEEGPAVQIMHVGPYSEEAPKLKLLEEFAKGKGFAFRGKHHEIYLSDPSRTAPEKLKTILRHPVERA